LRARVTVSVLSPDVPLGSVVGSPTLLISLSELAVHAHLVDLAITGIEHFSDGSSTIYVKAMVGSTVKVDLSDDNGITWSPLAKLTLSSSTATVNDPNTAGSTKRFYRAR
jgi:hypothetical protein